MDSLLIYLFCTSCERETVLPVLQIKAKTISHSKLWLNWRNYGAVLHSSCLWVEHKIQLKHCSLVVLTLQLKQELNAKSTEEKYWIWDTEKNCILSSGYICSEVHNASNVPNKTTDKTWLSDFTINDFYSELSIFKNIS